MSDVPRIVVKQSASTSAEQAYNARARAWKFTFDTYRRKAAEQDIAKTKQKSLNTEEGGSHDLT
jgi:hypothetical protein